MQNVVKAYRRPFDLEIKYLQALEQRNWREVQKLSALLSNDYVSHLRKI